MALAYLDQASSAASRLAEGDDDGDTLHQFRVGVRRLRACARAYDALFGDAIDKKARRRLERIASSTGPGRDAEVQLEWVERLAFGEDAAGMDGDERYGVEWLAARLTERKDAAYAEVSHEIPRRFAKLAARLREALSTYTVRFEVGQPSPLTGFGEAAADAIHGQIDTLVEQLGRVQSVADESIAHDARIHGKRLRYLLEPFRAEVPGAKDVVAELKVLQDLLGDLNDLHNLSNTVGQALEDTALDQARRLREAASEGYQDIAKALEHDERPGLLALLRRVQRDRAALFGRLQDDWLSESGRLLRLERSVRSLADAMGSVPREENVEIERKYLLRGLPAATRGHDAVQLDQGYLPGDKLIERVRRKQTANGAVFLRTVKLGAGLKRVEVEERCEESVFSVLWSLTEGRRVRKRRFAIPEGALVWEVDEFTDRELFLAEVELPTEETEVVIPEWLAPYVVRDVTDEPTYVNARLAR